MANPLDFTGKVVLVTGSSRGIGAEMIKTFGAHDAQCVVNYVADAQGQNKTDAMNLAHKGLYKDLQTIAPHQTWQETFWVRPSGF